MEVLKPEVNPRDENILTAYDESFVPWIMYANLQSSIQFADNKVNLLFVISGILLSIVIGDADDFKNESLAYKIVFFLFLISMIPFLYYSIRTVAAQTKHKSDVKSNKLYFFGDILSMQASEYIQNYKTQPRKEHYDEVLLQIHNLSHIAERKFYNYGRALYLLCLMICLLLALLILKVFL